MVEQNKEQQTSVPVKFEIWQPFLLAVAMSIGILLGYKMNDKTERLVKKVDADFVSLGRVEEVIRFIESRYVDTIASDTLMEEAVKAMVQRLDPHSIYLSPAELKEVTKPWMAALKALALKVITFRTLW
ncbi:MAG TPA: hypothetical protein PK037_15485 [Saprospiraceae bacterium]|nr:hypothetical protein [Saprospiraceae bacterium]